MPSNTAGSKGFSCFHSGSLWESVLCSSRISRIDKTDAEEQAGKALALHSQRVSRASLSAA